MKEKRDLDPQDSDSPTPYDLIGGDGGVRALVGRFYDLMDFEPDYARLRGVHGSTLEGAREKLYLQWMACMAQAMQEMEVPAALRQALIPAFYKTADWMRNR